MPICDTPSGITAVGCQHVGTICNDMCHVLIYCCFADHIAEGSRKNIPPHFARDNKFNFAAHVTIMY